MSKFASKAVTARPIGNFQTLGPTSTYEGGRGFKMDAKGELFTLALTYMGNDTFYEKDQARLDRMVNLVAQVAKEDPEWLAKFIPWCRDSANMRSASVIMGVEFARNVEGGRQVLNLALMRADEPAEALAYFMGKYGRKIPAAVKRGIADAVVKLYNQRSVNRWNNNQASLRMADVVELVHPKPRDQRQAELFKYLLDERHGRKPVEWGILDQLREVEEWKKNPTLDAIPNVLSWEQASSFFKMDAATWEAMIPTMGYMALLRNLRNFEEAGISEEMILRVIMELTDEANVISSRQLPFRFINAYKNLAGTAFVHAVQVALDRSIKNVPEMKGKTLILVDVSGSMQQPPGDSYRNRRGNAKSANMSEIAALFGVVVAKRCEEFALVPFATQARVINSFPIISTLKAVEQIESLGQHLGGGTNIDNALSNGLYIMPQPDRVFIFTDMQAHPSQSDVVKEKLTQRTSVHVWDLRGYGVSNIELGSGRYMHAGLNDQCFKMVEILDNWKANTWPWDHQ